MKAAVIFPGIGYHTDKPLLYYGKKLARESGYQIIEVNYTGFPQNVKGNEEKMKQSFQIARTQAEELLCDVNFNEYESVLFISKSIGTVVAAAYDKDHAVNAKHIYFTPVPQTFFFAREASGIVFHGLNDPWCETAVVEESCQRLRLPLKTFGGANHSLETGNCLKDLEIMGMIFDSLRGEGNAIYGI
ncbi:MAG: alpha/beta hydrolase [Lachnospiraceae bacterium]|nr:alpha/beta hydrolase [Lachnospiraceae bacterium]